MGLFALIALIALDAPWYAYAIWFIIGCINSYDDWKQEHKV